MRLVYLVCYDICDEKRLRRVAEVCSDFGVRLQYSVFECSLSDSEKVILDGKLLEIIDAGQDQVLYVSLGPSEGKVGWSITTLGLPYTRLAAPCYIL